VCRHLVQAVPEPERVVAEMARVLKPGGRLHLLAEEVGIGLAVGVVLTGVAAQLLKIAATLREANAP